MDEVGEERTPDVRHYLRILVKRRYQMIAVAAGIVAAATAGSYLLPKVYEAATTVSIERNYLSVLMRDMAVDPASEDRVRALSVVITGRSMLLRVLEGLGVDLASMSDVRREKLLRHFRSHTVIRFDADRSGRSSTDLFTVTFRDRDPRFARDYVNALVDSYVAESVTRSREAVVGANRFIAEQMEAYKDKIDRAEALLRQYGARTGAAAEARVRALRKKYDALLVQYTENHPEAVRLRAEIASAAEEARRQRQSWEEAKEQRGAVDERSIADLERERDTYRQVYAALVASLGKSEVSASMESRASGSPFNILEPAVMPVQPVSQPRWKLLLLGLLAGAAGGAGAVLLLDRFDRTIRSPLTLKVLGLQVVAQVPRIESAEATAAQRRKDVLVYGAAGLSWAAVLALTVVEYLKNR